MSKFQIILLAVFGASILLAVMFFSFSRGGSSSSVNVIAWGDIPSYDWEAMANATGLAQNKEVTVQYVERPTDTIMEEFTEALAEGRGPDLIVLSVEEMWKQKNRIIPIPYESVSERDFKSTFVEEGELFLSSVGIYALPISVDPLVLYYNRDLLTRAGIAQPIGYWDEIYSASSKLTQRDPAGNILRSAIAMGESSNIQNAKDILSLLMLQAGTPITDFSGSEQAPELRSELTNNFNLPAVPAEAALDFYTQFSNPTRSYYSWNRSLLPAQTHFASGDSAYYIGYASEFRILKAKNPTLNLGVTNVPQSRVSERNITLGNVRGIAISRSAQNPSAALTAALDIVSRERTNFLSESLLLPPARRDLLAIRPTDPVMSVFYDAALQSKGWIDPDVKATETVFKNMIEDVTSGRARVTEAIRKANDEVNALIR